MERKEGTNVWVRGETNKGSDGTPRLGWRRTSGLKKKKTMGGTRHEGQPAGEGGWAKFRETEKKMRGARTDSMHQGGEKNRGGGGDLAGGEEHTV